MRKIILFGLVLLFCLQSQAQVTIPQPSGTQFQGFGSATTWTKFGGYLYPFKAFVNSTYSDTTSANTDAVLKTIPGSQIRIGDTIFVRNAAATKWIRQINQNDIINITGCYVLLNGGIVSWSGSGLVMDVTNAHYIIGCNPYSSPTSQVTLSAADPSNPRIDVIAVDVNGQVVVIQGTAGATPVIPQVNPATQLFLTAILIPAGATTPGGITQTIVYDENTEWTSSATGSTNFNSTNNPFHLVKNALIPAGAEDILSWTNGSPVNLSDYSILKIYVRLDAVDPSGFDINAFLSLGGIGAPVSSVSLKDYGLSVTPSDVGNYQIITIPISAFNYPYTTFDGVNLKCTIPPGTVHIDYVQLQGGIPNGNSPYLTNVFIRNDSLFQTRNGSDYFVGEVGGGSGSVTAAGGLVVDALGRVRLDTAGVNPLTSDVLIDVGGYTFELTNGTFKLTDGTQGAGKVLTSDGSGNASWQTASSVNIYNSNGTFTGDRTGDLNSNRLDFTNTQRFRILDFNSTERLRIAQSGVGVAIGTQYTTKLSSGLNGTSRYLLLAPDSTILTGIPYTLSTTGKKIMIRDTATGLIENIDPALIGGSTPISSLTAATGANSIDNGDYNQAWNWNGFTGANGPGLYLFSGGDQMTTNGALMQLTFDGTHINSGITSTNLVLENNNSGTSSTNVGLNVSATFGDNNYAVIVPSGGGSVGIGTSAPAAILHTVGTVRHATLGTASADTTTYKPVGINSSGDIIGMTNWFGSGGGSTSPAGNFGNIQIARNGAFATPGSDSLDFESATGLTVKGNITSTALTSGRMVYASTSGLLADDANITRTGSGALAVATSVTSPLIVGGTGTTDPLTLQSSSNGSATTGAYIDFKPGTSSKARLLNNGNFGIGVTSPSGILSTYAASGTGTIFRVADGVYNYLGSASASPGAGEHWMAYHYTSNFGILDLSHPAGGNFQIRNISSGGFYLGSASGQAVILYPASTQMLSAYSTGVTISGSSSPTSGLDVQTSVSFKYSTTATSTTLTAAQCVMEVTATGQTITLPTAASIAGRIYTIKLTASGSGTVGTTSSQTIDGSTTYSLSAQYKYVTVQSNGSNWNVIANN